MGAIFLTFMNSMTTTWWKEDRVELGKDGKICKAEVMGGFLERLRIDRVCVGSTSVCIRMRLSSLL